MRVMVLPPIRYYVKITAAIIVTLVLAYSVYRARSILILIFLGMFLAVGLEPAIGRLERRGIRRGFAVLGFGLLLAGILVALVFLVIAPAAAEVTNFVSNVPDLIDDLNRRLEGTALGDYLQQPDVQDKVQEGFTAVLERSAGGIFGIVGGVISAVFTAITLFVLTIYFMLAMPRLRAGADRILGTEDRRAVLAEALAKVGGYVTGQLAICVCAGVSTYIALLALGVPYPALLAIVVAVLDAIPQVGATIGAVVAVLVALTVSLPVALGALIYFVVYQQLENYLIAPRVFSQTVSLSPLASLLSVLVGASLSGVVGAIVALPITAAGLVVFRATRPGQQLLGEPDPDPSAGVAADTPADPGAGTAQP
jgi:predicted PurR-regulated permease PerM